MKKNFIRAEGFNTFCTLSRASFRAIKKSIKPRMQTPYKNNIPRPNLWFDFRAGSLIICLFVFTILLLAVFTGCGSISNPRSDRYTAEIAQKDYNYEKTFFGTHNIEFEIHIENIVHQDNRAKLIEELIYQSKNSDEYAAYLEKRFLGEASAEDYPVLMNDDGTQYIYHSSLTENYSVEFHNEDYAIILYNTYYYRSGAAHGYYWFEYNIIDIAERRLLDINDLITSIPDSVLKELITDEYGFDNFLRGNIWPPDTINIKSDGVELLWNVYTITSYAAGPVSIIIPETIADYYLTNNGKAIKAARRNCS